MAVDTRNFDISRLDSVKIGESDFDASWLSSTLDENDQEFKKIHDGNAVRSVITTEIGDGKGFVSKVYKCSIEFESDRPDYEVIMKVPGAHALQGAVDSAGTEDAFCVSVTNVHNMECRFYTDYAAKADFPTAKVYSAGELVPGSKPGYLLMESMIGKGESCCVFEGLSKAQLFKIAEHLAHFQHAFLTMEDKSWLQHFDPLKSFTDEDSITFVRPMFEKLVKMRPDVFEEKMKPLRAATEKKGFFGYTMFDHIKDFGVPPVLSHGDLWSNNIMWKLDENGFIVNEIAAVIDFQLAHVGSITNDLARVLVCCSDAEIRRQYEEAVLKRYHDTLSRLFAKDGKEVPFDFEKVKEVYKISQLCQTVDILWMIPLFCDGEKKPGSEALWEARTDKIVLRASLALDEALKTLETLPEEYRSD